MPHKYHNHIESLSDCPPTACEAREVTAFRFVFDDLADQRNYEPPYIISPNRRNSAASDATTCDGYGLSFFDSLAQSTTFYAKLKSNFKKIHLRLGTQVAQVGLLEQDGLCTDVQDNGHFTLHEYEGVTFVGRLQIVQHVYP
jgi:hypothetical protein